MLDFGSFTQRGLMMDHVHHAEAWGVGGGGGVETRKSGGCKTRKEEVEERQTTDLSVMRKW